MDEKTRELLTELCNNGMGEVFINHAFENLSVDLLFDMKQEINGRLLESDSELILNSIDFDAGTNLFKMVICDGKELFSLEFGAVIEKLGEDEFAEKYGDEEYEVKELNYDQNR